MSELREYLCIEAKTIEREDFLCYRFTSATKAAPEACMEEVYLKSEADEVIEKKDKEIRKLKCALYKACANWAMAEAYSVLNDVPTSNRWIHTLRKLKAKLEEYR